LSFDNFLSNALLKLSKLKKKQKGFLLQSRLNNTGFCYYLGLQTAKPHQTLYYKRDRSECRVSLSVVENTAVAKSGAALAIDY